MLFEKIGYKSKSTRWVMKRISLFTAVMLSFLVGGCYTQLATKDNSAYGNDQYESEYEYYDSSSDQTSTEYYESDTYRDYGYTSDQEVYDDGEVIINNYYYDGYRPYRKYLSYYHPGVSVSFGFSVWDPWYDPWYYPWDPYYVSWYNPWYSPYWYYPAAVVVYPAYAWNWNYHTPYYNNFGGTKYRNHYSPRVRNSGNGRGLYAGRNNPVRDRNDRNSNALLDNDVRSARTTYDAASNRVSGSERITRSNDVRSSRSERTYLDDIRTTRNDDKGRPAVRNNSSRETSRVTDRNVRSSNTERNARTYVDDTRRGTERDDRSGRSVQSRPESSSSSNKVYTPPGSYRTKESSNKKPSVNSGNSRSVEQKRSTAKPSNNAGYQRKSSSNNSKPSTRSYSSPTRQSSPSVSTPRSSNSGSRSSGTSSRSSSGGSSNSSGRTRR
jgi:hypothetical protein